MRCAAVLKRELIRRVCVNGNDNVVVVGNGVAREHVARVQRAVRGSVIAGAHYKAGFVVGSGCADCVDADLVYLVNALNCLFAVRVVIVNPPLVVMTDKPRLVHNLKNQPLVIILEPKGKLSPDCRNVTFGLLEILIFREHKSSAVIVVNVEDNEHIALETPIYNLVHAREPLFANRVIIGNVVVPRNWDTHGVEACVLEHLDMSFGVHIAVPSGFVEHFIVHPSAVGRVEGVANIPADLNHFRKLNARYLRQI